MSKFHAVPLDSEGRSRQVCGFLNIAFKKAWDSTGEYTRYIELLRLQGEGQISNLRTQVTYELHAVNSDGNRHKIGSYIADFVYDQDGRTVVEDFKGVKTAMYSWKKRHMKIEYGVVIYESNAPVRKKRRAKK